MLGKYVVSWIFLVASGPKLLRTLYDLRGVDGFPLTLFAYCTRLLRPSLPPSRRPGVWRTPFPVVFVASKFVTPAIYTLLVFWLAFLCFWRQAYLSIFPAMISIWVGVTRIRDYWHFQASFGTHQRLRCLPLSVSVNSQRYGIRFGFEVHILACQHHIGRLRLLASTKNLHT